MCNRWNLGGRKSSRNGITRQAGKKKLLKLGPLERMGRSSVLPADRRDLQAGVGKPKGIEVRNGGVGSVGVRLPKVQVPKGIEQVVLKGDDESGGKFCFNKYTQRQGGQGKTYKLDLKRPACPEKSLQKKKFGRQRRVQKEEGLLERPKTFRPR